MNDNSLKKSIFQLLNTIDCNKIYYEVFKVNYNNVLDCIYSETLKDCIIYKDSLFGKIIYSSINFNKYVKNQDILNSNYLQIINELYESSNFELNYSNILKIYKSIIQRTNYVELSNNQNIFLGETGLDDSGFLNNHLTLNFEVAIQEFLNNDEHFLINLGKFVYNFLKCAEINKIYVYVLFLTIRGILINNGYQFFKYVCLEKYIYDYKNELFESFFANDIELFIYYFLKVINKIYESFSLRYHIVDGLKQNKSSRIRLTIFKSLKPVSKEEIHLLWPDISYNAIELEISKLLKNKEIVKIGITKGVKYIHYS